MERKIEMSFHLEHGFFKDVTWSKVVRLLGAFKKDWRIWWVTDKPLAPPWHILVSHCLKRDKKVSGYVLLQSASSLSFQKHIKDASSSPDGSNFRLFSF